MFDTGNLIPAGSADQPIWVSGGSYVIGNQVVSPSSYKIYTRKTNGAGTTDPSADATNWASQIKNSTLIVVRPFAATGSIITPLGGNADGVTRTQSGSTTAGALKTIFSYTNGGGIMSHLSAYTADATARTLRLKVTIDGVIAYDNTSSSISSINRGFVLSGSITNSGATVLPALMWANSIVVEIASSLTESNGITLEYIYDGVA